MLIHRYTNSQIHKYTNTQIQKHKSTQIRKRMSKVDDAFPAVGAELGWRRMSINCNCRHKLGDMKIQIENLKIRIEMLETGRT